MDSRLVFLRPLGLRLHGRGYGHDYMRGGEVLGGYGYSARAEYETPRGELSITGEHEHVGPSDELVQNAAGP